MDMDTLFFFNGMPRELSLYEGLLEKLRELGPWTAVVHKTQISLNCRRMFAAVSMTRVRRKALLPEHFIVVTLGLPHNLESSRPVQVSVRPNRWTHHVVIGRLEDLDEELMAWLREAYAFADR